MIFVSGIHGVGKSFFCRKLKEVTGIDSYTSSNLIEKKQNIEFTMDKKVSSIGDNQNYLLEAVRELKQKESFFVLDGHFCLLDKEERITRIQEQTFIDLNPQMIILLTEKAEVITERRLLRDGMRVNLEMIQKFQQSEEIYAKEIAEKLGIPIKILKGANDIDDVIKFIMNWRK